MSMETSAIDSNSSVPGNNKTGGADCDESESSSVQPNSSSLFTSDTKDSDSNAMKKTENAEQESAAQIKDSDNVTAEDNDLEGNEMQSNKDAENDANEGEEEEACDDKNEEHDPYSYTKLNDFTSEIFKIEINNLPKHMGYSQLRKLLNTTLALEPRKIKAIKSIQGKSRQPVQFVFATFQDEEHREKALNILNGYVWKGKTLSAKKANPAADPLIKKRRAGDAEDSPAAKKLKEDDTPVELKLKNAVTPFWNIPYEEQLKKKEDDVKQFLVKLGRSIEKTNRNLISKLNQYRSVNQRQCCPLNPIKPSPSTSAYRNKCEFTVGRHLHSKEKTVGFRLSSYKAGSMSVAEPDDCVNVSPTMLKAVKSFQDYIRSSDKDVYNPENHEGFWRQLTVRTSNNSDILIIIVMHPQSLSEAELETEKNNLRVYYETGPGSTFGITSVYFQSFSKRECSDSDPNLSHLTGKKHLVETLLGMDFQISPESFFQINVPATEVLYSMVTSYVKASPELFVLDICCGTGTISLCLAKAGAKVLGIEMSEKAVENARFNAEKNGITNVDFLCGKAEDQILTALHMCKDSPEIIAVVDPPRAGLHQKVLKAIRATDRINRLIYIACNPNSAFNNFTDLCRPTSNNYKGDPFYPIEAAVVDMFPHTPHKELVLIFERHHCT